MITAVEFFSGIGGMHAALKCLADENIKIIGAYDINPWANEVYKFNFPDVPLKQRNLMSIQMEEIALLNADLWTMSPPCQPFSRLGLKNDLNDKRTDSFQHLLFVLSKMKNPPRYIFIENVKGFENSKAHDEAVLTLQRMQYTFREFLLSPKQFGIPNSRLRYYLLARLIKKVQPFPSTLYANSIITVPPCEADILDCKSLSIFFENETTDYFDGFLLKPEILVKHGEVLDIVDGQGESSCCFTRGYSHMIQGAGSVLKQNNEVQINDAYAAYRASRDFEGKLASLKSLKLRWFTPREILNLSGFPATFKFPPNLITLEQSYRLLGNSINVYVVSRLFKLLLSKNEDFS